MFEQDIRLGPGTGTYSQHTWEILIMLLGAFLLGIWLGWILWNKYKQEAEKLRLDNQSLKITSDSLTTELSTLKAKYAALETDNGNLSAQIVSLNRNNTNLRDRIAQMETDVEETQSRNMQVETELGLSYTPDTPVVDDIPLEVVAQDNPEPEPEAPAMSPAEPDVVAPVVATVPPDNNISVVISEGANTLAEVTIQNVASDNGEEKAPLHVEVTNNEPTETLSTPAAPSIVPTPEPETLVVGAAAATAQDDLTVVEGIGPKIQMLLNQYGVRTYRQLADTPVERLREILTNAGPQLAMHDPGTWPSQANLAANDQWDALKSIQGFLKGGKKPT